MAAASELYERITYTASLATSPTEIDTILDNFRMVSARISPNQQLNVRDQDTLLDTQRQLEDYLVNREHIRTFTPDSLRLQIEQHMSGEVNQKSRTQLLIVLYAAVGLAAGTALLPVESAEQRILVASTTVFSVMTTGAGWLFLTALHAFKSRVRRAFIAISTGVVLLGLSLLGQPIMEIFQLRDHPWVSALYPLSLLVATFFFYGGNALYARLVGVQSRWVTLWPVVVGCAAVSVCTWFLPHPYSHEPELIHDVASVIWGCMLVMSAASAVALYMSARILPELYKHPVRLWFYAMFPILAVVGYRYVLRTVTGPLLEGTAAYVLFIIVIAMSVSILRAGYAFNKVSRY